MMQIKGDASGERQRKRQYTRDFVSAVLAMRYG
jgi:hypothetical protein